VFLLSPTWRPINLAAAALSLETGLTDATLLMFDCLMGSLSRKAERKSEEKAASAARDLQEKLRVLTERRCAFNAIIAVYVLYKQYEATHPAKPGWVKGQV
jgi:hypothetical protein